MILSKDIRIGDHRVVITHNHAKEIENTLVYIEGNKTQQLSVYMRTGEKDELDEWRINGMDIVRFKNDKETVIKMLFMILHEGYTDNNIYIDRDTKLITIS